MNIKILKNSFFALCFSLLVSIQIKAQVQSKAYKTVLEGMYKKSVPLVTCDELKKQKNTILLDTRTKREFEVSHIKNARWVGYEEFKIGSVKDIAKETPIVVYCSVGYRSERIGEQLQRAGYKNIKNLYGSLFEWSNQGNEMVDIQEKPTTKIHAYDHIWGIWVKKGEKVYE